MDANSCYRSLISTECPGCEGEKPSRKSFCKACYFRLPKELRDGLWKRIHAGYEQAFNRALHWLQEHPKQPRRPAA